MVRGTDAIQRVLKLTGVEEMLVLVDDPDDLVPPPVTHRPRAVNTRCYIEGDAIATERSVGDARISSL